MKSRLFKEAFKYLSLNDNHEPIINNEIISGFINKIIYLPCDLPEEGLFHDYINFITFISTIKKEINTNFVEQDSNMGIILENAAIVVIIYHAYIFAINSVMAFMEKNLNLNQTQRKKNLNIKVSIYHLDMALFRKETKMISLGEALYILNEENYNKSLDEFRKGFMELDNKDLIIKGQFNDLNLLNEKTINEFKWSLYIKIKKDDNDIFDRLKDIYISIPLRNDIIGRHISEKDLEPFL